MRDRFVVYLVRHAIAAVRGPAWPDDDLRPLTSRGAARFRQVIAGLVTLDVTADEIVTSPLVRARQTADLLASRLRGGPPVVELAALAPSGSVNGILEGLAARADRESLVLVGHEPGLGQLAAALVGASAPFAFKKGGVCRIEFNRPVSAGQGRLAWFAPPRLLRKLGE